MCSTTAIMPRRLSASCFMRTQFKRMDKIGRTASAPAAFEAGTHRNQPLPTQPANRRPSLSVVNWNVAAPNNNPFEYWAAHEDESYNELMSSMQECIDNPAKIEVEIGEIFTDKMFEELKTLLEVENVPRSQISAVESMWKKDIKSRKSISGFLKDISFGEKRLISMPDRITGWIKSDNGTSLFRPSPITAFKEEMSNVQMWWTHWKQFMFKTPLDASKKDAKSVFSLLEIIPRAKYPALSEMEEAVSVPLQTLCLALFDAVFTHILCTIAPKTWQPLKQSLHSALYHNKTRSCISILEKQYFASDIIFIQEASDAFASQAEKHLNHLVLRPARADTRRSQMSLILARRGAFDAGTAREVTAEVEAMLKVRCVEPGDLCVYTIDASPQLSGARQRFLLASFHGDSNGKGTLPVLTAVTALAQERYPDHTLVFGLDANTVSGAPTASSPLSAADFAAAVAARGLGCCWPTAAGDLDGLWTTYNARTYLQPQLHKAVGLRALMDRRHMQLKDWVVFSAGAGGLELAGTERDNTGCRKFRRAVMPSQTFPSDHAIVSVSLRRRG